MSRASYSIVSHIALFSKMLTSDRSTTSYFEVKQSNPDYCIAKQALIGESCPFSGWRGSGVEWESFNDKGECTAQWTSLFNQQT
jgi:hypothetical protein